MKFRNIALSRNILVGGVALFMLASAALPDCAAKSKPKAKGANTAEPSEQNLEEGVERYKKRDFDGAIDSFLQSTYFARNGYAPEAYYWLGKSYMAKHEDVKAIEAFKKHIAQNMKKTPQAHVYLAEVLLRNDKDEEAFHEANCAIGDSEDNCPTGKNILGEILVKKRAFIEAESQFLDALGQHPWKYTVAWMNLAEARMKDHKWIGAYEQLEKILDAKGRLENLDLPKVYYDMGLCQLARGDHQGAIDHFHQALEINPDYYLAHLELAILFESEKHWSSAIKEYSEFVRTAPPDNPKVRLAKERILLLDQKLQAEAPAPAVVPSPYMRAQQQQEVKRIQQNQPPKDPGF